ncbi:MAG: DUF1223 domain-containing protein [Candidatus Melainabacteria bacterium]|nr:DUF1223 domain-containing protein [Candidatus Melainabacteria bacterium]
MRLVPGILFLAALLAMVSTGASRADSGDDRPPVVVELFTSEGCSSCPPADKLLAELSKMNGSSVIILSEHVDYWDYLGWRDPFSAPLFTDRQRHYARVLNQDSVYTPEIVINGAIGFVGTDRQKAEKEITGRTALPRDRFLFEAVEKNNGHSADIVLKDTGLPLSKDERMVVFLTEDQVSVPVRAGENSGRVLNHAGVVRESLLFDKVPPRFELPVPSSGRSQAFKVVVLRQNMRTMSITGAGASRLVKAI